MHRARTACVCVVLAFAGGVTAADSPVPQVPPEALAGPIARHAHPSLVPQVHLPRVAPTPTTGVTITSLIPSAGVVACYSRLDLQVVLNQTIAQPFDVDPLLGGLDLSATFTAPSGATWTVPAFFDGTTIPGRWMVRFRPNEVDGPTAWQVTVSARSASGTSTASSSFSCLGMTTTAAHKGWARIQGTGMRYSGDGTWFWGLGHNTGWQSQVETPSMTEMQAQGETLLSFWMSEPWERQVSDGNVNHSVLPARAPLETANVGIGIYNQAACAYIDGVVADAEAAGISLVPSLWAHDELQDALAPWGPGSWDNNAYNLICATAGDFFTLQDSTGHPTQAWHYQQNRYRYIAARWASSPAIVGWVGMVEIDGTSGAALPGCQAWCSAVRSCLASYDPYRRSASGAYPLTVTKTDSTPGATTWNAFLDLCACDSYNATASTAAIGATIASETTALLGAGKPSFQAEFGATITAGTAGTVSQPDHLRRGVMTGLATGAVCSPLLWTDGYNFPLVQGGTASGLALEQQYHAIGAFARQQPLLGDPSLVAVSLAVSDPQLEGWGRRDAAGTEAFVWIEASAALSSFVHPRVTIGGLSAGDFQVTWTDVSTGAALAPSLSTTGTVMINGTTSLGLVLTVPSFAAADVALRLSFQPASTVGTSVTGASATTGTGTGTGTGSSVTVPGNGGGSGGGGGCGLGTAGVLGLLGAALIPRRRRRSPPTV